MRILVTTMINILVLGMAFASKMHGNGVDIGLQNNGLYQGDIADSLYSNSFRSAIPKSARLWQNHTVNYNIASSVAHLRVLIEEAVRQIESQTCLKFKEVSGNHNSDFVHFTRKDGCWSHMGRKGDGGQDLSLGDQCPSLGIVLHEVLHSLGLGHEHARSDRDDHVKILWDNIHDGQTHNFEKLYPWENNLMDEPFDFDSVMMYGKKAFSIDGESTTIESKKNPFRKLPPIGEKIKLSAGDVRKINKLYECKGYKRPSPPEVPPFSCDFESSNCGLYNQEEDGLALWKARNGQLLTLQGDHTSGGGTYMAVSATETNDQPARLLSSNFLSYERDEGCLSFDLHFNGDGADSLGVYVQSENGLDEIFIEDRSSFLQWKRIKLDVYPIKSSFRFFFEANTASSHPGLIAIDDVKFNWKPC